MCIWTSVISIWIYDNKYSEGENYWMKIICYSGLEIWFISPPVPFWQHEEGDRGIVPRQYGPALPCPAPCPPPLCMLDGGSGKVLIWHNTIQPSVLLAVVSQLRVSMATQGLGNPWSSSRWGNDAVVCLCVVCLVYLSPSNRVRQIHSHAYAWLCMTVAK